MPPSARPPAITTLFGIDESSELLRAALTHPSYTNEARGEPHYQRLEFLGDAVLGLCASELLYERWPEADEGTLTRMRAGLVNAEALAAWAREQNLGEALRLGRGADTPAFRKSTSALADLVEALVAVAYLEGGHAAARRACETVLGGALAALEANAAQDPKSELQERVQRQGLPVPVYEVTETGGSAHAPWFEVVVRVNGKILGSGRGRSKRLAERRAAEMALTGTSPPPGGQEEEATDDSHP